MKRLLLMWQRGEQHYMGFHLGELKPVDLLYLGIWKKDSLKEDGRQISQILQPLGIRRNKSRRMLLMEI